MNRVVLVGRITHDLELRYTSTGIAVVNFLIAVNRYYQNEQGEREADFIRCVAWRGQAENMVKFVKKGSLIGVDGRIQSSNYETPQGEKRTAIDVVADQVVFLEPKSTKEETGYEPSYGKRFEDEYDEADELLKSAIDVDFDDEIDAEADDKIDQEKLPF